jgi:putative nucleotidyltransferase with HDIG domain
MKAMFERAFATALYAQEIARTRRMGVEQAFLSGLFHDVGRPLVLQLVIDLHAECGVTVDDAAVVAAVDDAHAEIGARVVEAWKLGAAVASAVRYHHQFEQDRGAALAALADVFAGVAFGDAGVDDVRGHASLPALGLYVDDVDRLLAMGPSIAGRVAQVV